jgi:hypothetical protein
MTLSRHPSNPNLIRVVPGPMFRLYCSVAPGVFSNERLIHSNDASGAKQSALVDRDVVHGDERSWVLVRGVNEGSTVVVALPGDGSRVRVPATSVEVASIA